MMNKQQQLDKQITNETEKQAAAQAIYSQALAPDFTQ
jgi:hypothetical protein